MSVIVSPIAGEVIADVPAVDPELLDDVFALARQAFETWRATPPRERRGLLVELASRIRAHADELADLETANTGKLLSESRREVARAADCFDYYAGWIDKLTGETIPVGSDFHAYTLREPVGTVVGVVPWSAPLLLAARKIAPAVAFGNAVVIKPAEETPLTALELQRVSEASGVPRGLVQVVTGDDELETALVEHPGSSLLVFGGPHEAGKAIAKEAATHVMRTVLELGGKSPQLVFEDADLDAALRGIMIGGYGSCGQTPVAGSRIFVQRSIYDTFVSRLADRVRTLKVGDPRMASTDVGPQTTRAQRDRTLRMIETGRREGARVLASAETGIDRCPAGGFYVTPTAFGDVDHKMTIMRDEIFGPVVAVARFRDEDDALRHAHETHFGLAAGVWTADVARAHRMARALNVGTVWVNSYRASYEQVPVGGVGLSGYGREGGREAIDVYTRSKSVWTALVPGGATDHAL